MREIAGACIQQLYSHVNANLCLEISRSVKHVLLLSKLIGQETYKLSIRFRRLIDNAVDHEVADSDPQRPEVIIHFFCIKP